MVKSQHLIIALLVVLVALVAYGIFTTKNTEPALDEALAGSGAAGGDSDLIVTPFLYQSGQDYIAVFHKSDKKRAGATSKEWYMSVYEMKQGQYKLGLKATRNIEWDFYYNAGLQETSRSDGHPDRLRDKVQAGAGDEE